MVDPSRGSLGERVPERLGFFSDGPCEWCKTAPGVMIVNLPGNALETRVCRACFSKARREGGNWWEICYNCMGTGDLGDNVSPCAECDASGYDDEQGSDDDEDALYMEAGQDSEALQEEIDEAMEEPPEVDDE